MDANILLFGDAPLFENATSGALNFLVPLLTNENERPSSSSEELSAVSVQDCRLNWNSLDSNVSDFKSIADVSWPEGYKSIDNFLELCGLLSLQSNPFPGKSGTIKYALELPRRGEEQFVRGDRDITPELELSASAWYDDYKI
jgi:hypothetical protein